MSSEAEFEEKEKFIFTTWPTKKIIEKYSQFEMILTAENTQLFDFY